MFPAYAKKWYRVLYIRSPRGVQSRRSAPHKVGYGGAPLADSSSAVIALDDPLAFVLHQGAQEGNEAATDGRGEVQAWFVEHLDHGASRVDGLKDVGSGRVTCS